MASWLDELLNEVGDAIHDGLVSIIERSLQATQELLAMGMDNNANSDGLFGNFLSQHPANFDASLGTAATSVNLWETMETLCSNAVVPIAGMIMVIVLINDLIQVVVSGNNFRDFDLFILFKWIMKCVCGVLLVSNVYYIASACLTFGTSATTSAINSIFNLDGSYLDGSISITIDGSTLGIPELLLSMLLCGFLMLIICALLVVMIVVLSSRMIEIFMYLAVSPLPVATMMNHDWGEIGKNWIRNMIALAFQGFFIIIALSIFQTIFDAVLAGLASSPDGLWLQLILLMGYALALCFTVLKSGSISKSVFNAH